ncbi:MAG: DUF340 domain-containing protein [Phascolarctobacterium sp.]|nr:DUF340 domain-containing protein [Phascolarctobacterium sp.]
MNIKDCVIILCIMIFMSLFSNVLGTPATVIESIPGLIMLADIALLGILMAKYLPGNIPSVAYIVTLGCFLTYPGVPGSDFITAHVSKVGFIALCTPLLAYAGIAIGKDLDTFKKNGWRIVVLACVVFTGTYIGSAIIAQAILKFLGQI